MTTICFTGHRPDKLGGYDWSTEKNKRIMEKLKDIILEVLNTTCENDFTFICGGALGIDQMAFDICKNIKYSTLNVNKMSIKLVLAMPFEKQASKWIADSIKKLNHQRQEADEVVLVDTVNEYKFDKVILGEYHPAKMQLRNQYMVDKSDIVIAVWNGSKGGTGNCVNYAKKKEKKIIILNPDEI
jgi:uncharacterized phage-like protein YoqJ